MADKTTIEWTDATCNAINGCSVLSRSLRDQCAAAGVAFHFKQWGEFLQAGQRDKITFQADADGRQVDLAMMLQGAKAEPLDGLWTYRVGKKVAGRLLDGVEHNGMPS